MSINARAFVFFLLVAGVGCGVGFSLLVADIL